MTALAKGALRPFFLAFLYLLAHRAAHCRKRQICLSLRIPA